MSRWVEVLSVTGITACAAAAPALGVPAWTTSNVLSGSGERASEPAVAVSAGGRMLAAWVAVRGEVEIQETPVAQFIGSGRIEARLGTSAHGWRGSQVLGSNGESPIAAVGANGTAAVAWCRRPKNYERLSYVSIARPGARFGPARLVSAPRGQSFPSCPEALEVQPDGRVVLIFSETLVYEAAPLRSRIRFALLRAPGNRPVIGIVTSNVRGEVALSTAETEAGDILLGFGQEGADGPQSVAQLHPGARRFSIPQALNVPGSTIIRDAHVSAGPGGASLVFDASEYDPSGQKHEENGMAELQSDGSFGPAVPTIVPRSHSSGQLTLEYTSLSVAFPAGGERVAVWDSTLRGPTPPGPGEEGVVHSVTVLAAVRSVGAADFQAPVQLAAGPGRSGAPMIASAGTSTLALWVQDEAHCKQRVYAATGAPGTPSAHVRALSSSYTPAKGECAKGNGQLVLAGSSAGAIAGWVQNSRLHVAATAGGSSV